nr:MAG TPA: hypothetical protein [Caudoviricetes sp.]
MVILEDVIFVLFGYFVKFCSHINFFIPFSLYYEYQ